MVATTVLLVSNVVLWGVDADTDSIAEGSLNTAAAGAGSGGGTDPWSLPDSGDSGAGGQGGLDGRVDLRLEGGNDLGNQGVLVQGGRGGT